jgi:hypothetical protein
MDLPRGLQLGCSPLEERVDAYVLPPVEIDEPCAAVSRLEAGELSNGQMDQPPGRPIRGSGHQHVLVIHVDCVLGRSNRMHRAVLQE